MMTDLDRQALAEVEADLEAWAGHLERFEIKSAMEVCFHAGQVGNRYFDESAPFKTRKTDMDRCGHSLGVSIQILARLAVMLAPVVPFAMEKLWGWLGLEADLWQAGWDEGRKPVPAGRTLGKPEILFPRLDNEVIQPEIERLNALLGDASSR